MTSKEAIDNIAFYSALHNGVLDSSLKVIYKELEILDILKPRIHLEDNKLKNAHFTIDEKGLPHIDSDFKEVDVVFIEASGFVFKNSIEYKLLKEWLEK